MATRHVKSPPGDQKGANPVGISTKRTRRARPRRIVVVVKSLDCKGFSRLSVRPIFVGEAKMTTKSLPTLKLSVGINQCQARSGDQRCTLFGGRLPLRRRLGPFFQLTKHLGRNSRKLTAARKPIVELHRGCAAVDHLDWATGRRDVLSILGVCSSANSLTSPFSCVSPELPACAGRRSANYDRWWGFRRRKHRLTRLFPVACVLVGVTARPRPES